MNICWGGTQDYGSGRILFVRIRIRPFKKWHLGHEISTQFFWFFKLTNYSKFGNVKWESVMNFNEFGRINWFQIKCDINTCYQIGIFQVIDRSVLHCLTGWRVMFFLLEQNSSPNLRYAHFQALWLGKTLGQPIRMVLNGTVRKFVLKIVYTIGSRIRGNL